MPELERPKFAWMDLLLLIFLGCLAVLYPLTETHAQIVLLAIGVFQVFERWFLQVAGQRGGVYSVILKTLLASLLIAHTGGVESSYYLIYYLPVVTAAMYFGARATLFWTAVVSLSYWSFVLSALTDFDLATSNMPDLSLRNLSLFIQYQVTATGTTELAIRNIFFFLAAILVNRFVVENRRQSENYQRLAEELAETNRQLERAEAEARRSERLAALGQLTAGLAHEIRNPLGVIKGSAETLNKKLAGSDAIAVELAGYISEEVNRLNSIVTRFLDFARPHELEKTPVDLTAILERALKAARDRWPEAQVEVERQFAAGVAPIPADAALCEQVFTNLVMNAYEAMEPKGGQLRVSVAPKESHSQRGVEVAVQDSGPGVPGELREQIFNPFFTTKKSGVGLGLSIVSKIVDDHRGWIRVENAPGGGACFRVFLPA
ncbi:MAG TPA: ATP-binding protein [Terriglobia bacterium]|nr:ATP-binding protein [Terriglobia bacterium]